MTRQWPRVKLGEVLRIDLDRYSIDAAATYPMVGVLSFGRGLFDREPIENGNTSYRFFYRLKAKHVVMSQLFGWEGALALSSEKFAGKFLSPQFPTFLCDEKKLNREFLGWLMRRPAFWEDLGSRTSGMGDRRQTLNPEALFKCEIPLPPLAEQKRLVARIEELAAHIDKARSLRTQVADEVEALCRAIIYEDGATSLTPMSELVRLRSPDVIVEATETYQFAGVYSFGRGVFRGQAKSGMEFAYPKLTRLKAGNFVYPKLMAWEGALGIVPPSCDECVVSTEFPVFEVLEDRVLPEVLDTYFRMPAVWPLLSGASTGTNVRRRRFNPVDFLKYKIPLPSRSAQEQLRKIRAEVHTLQCLQVESSVELDALLPAALDRAFNGEF
ncbi:MAG: restriction endonuclease subunit S [Methylocella sp.]